MPILQYYPALCRIELPAGFKVGAAHSADAYPEPETQLEYEF